MSRAPRVVTLPKSERPYLPDDSLVYYDGPLVLWLAIDGLLYLAIALPESEDAPWPFLLAEVSPAQQALVNAGALPLRTAVLQSPALYYLPDYWADLLVLSPAPNPPAEAWLPDPDVCITVEN